MVRSRFLIPRRERFLVFFVVFRSPSKYFASIFGGVVVPAFSAFFSSSYRVESSLLFIPYSLVLELGAPHSADPFVGVLHPPTFRRKDVFDKPRLFSSFPVSLIDLSPFSIDALLGAAFDSMRFFCFD